MLGQFTAWSTTLPPVEESSWEYKLPELSESLSQAYRSTLIETGVAVAKVMEAHPRSPHSISALALLHYLAHDRTGEERCWQRCLELDPKNNLAYSRLVALAQQVADYSRIVELMKQALVHEPKSGTYRSMLGSALMYLNRPDEARAALESNLASGDANEETFLLLGEVYYQLDQPEKAKRDFSLTADLAPQRATRSMDW